MAIVSVPAWDCSKQVCVYVEEIPDAFDYLKEEDAFYEKPSYDLFISLDCGDEERLGDAQKVMEKTPYVLNIDHHITNTKFGNENVVKEASSTCEILYGLMEEEKLDAGIAGALYTGIIHDTGVFKHSKRDYGNCRKADCFWNPVWQDYR